MIMSSERNDNASDLEALELIRASNVLNPEATMEKILKLTQTLIRLEITEDSASRVRGHDWVCISKYFIVAGDYPKR